MPSGQIVAAMLHILWQLACLFSPGIYRTIVNLSLASRPARKSTTTMKTFWPAAIEPVALSLAEAHLYAVPIDETSDRWVELCTVLTPDERQRAAQFRVEPPRRRFVTARAALRILLSRYLDLPPAAVTLSLSPNGKPRLGDQHRQSGLHFNVSHSGNMALVVLARGCEVGVDVEQLRAVRHVQHIAKRYFHASEIEAILSAPPAGQVAAFLRCWTGKEAVLKAIGMGITGSLAAFHVPNLNDEGAYVEVPTHPHGRPTQIWLQQFMLSNDYLAAVACADALRKVRCFEFDA